MIDTDVLLRTTAGERHVSLASYLAPADEEAAHEDAYAWIKELRNVAVDGTPFRDRFAIRGDSLWWFTEIYLHREQVILNIHLAIAALEALIRTERPLAFELRSGSAVVRFLAPLVGASRGVPSDDPVPASLWWRRMLKLDLRARSLNFSALVSADRRRGTPGRSGRTPVAAFIHRAFWRAGGEDGSAESYIGPVLQELERRAGADAVAYVGIGPSSNFRSARQRSLAQPGGTPLVPVERYAPLKSLIASRSMWRRRYAHFATLRKSPALRGAASIKGIDCWPLVREQLAGVAWLQWPWSVRAMDEAAAALDVLTPSVALTYAEAGGWGRALVLESRRRGIPSVGLQHGFIYRHWLNYRHEPDEMQARGTPAFPRPDRTLLFDTYAKRHLEQRGHFSSDALVVTGSPRLDELRGTIHQLSTEDKVRVRRALGVTDSQAIVLITTKEKEARSVLGPFCAAAARSQGAAIVIKPHPAETADAYAELVRAVPEVRLSPPATTLAELLAVAQAVVTVNSTVALDAAAFDIPVLVLGLPNNLSPFVDAGAFAGSTVPAEAAGLLDRILYDEGFRQTLAERRRDVLGDASANGPGRASAASAEAVMSLVNSDGRPVAGSGR